MYDRKICRKGKERLSIVPVLKALEYQLKICSVLYTEPESSTWYPIAF